MNKYAEALNKLLLKRGCKREFVKGIKELYDETFDQYSESTDFDTFIGCFYPWDLTKSGDDFWSKINQEWLKILEEL